VFNGSRLGKEFSANSLNQDFNKIDEIDKINEIPKITGNEVKDMELKSCQSFNPENHGSDISGIFDLFTSDNSTSDEIEEQAFIRRMKKKCKRQIRI